MTTVTGVFKNRPTAEQAISQLEMTGITADQISLVMTEGARNSHFEMQESSKVEEGATVGAGVGGLLGAIAATVLSAGALAIPGLNVVVTGAFVAALAGLGAGGLTGGLIGGLVGSGIPEHEAKLLEKEVKAGSVLVAVKTMSGDQKKRVEEIFRNLETNRAAA